MSDFPPDGVAFVTGAASGIGLAVSRRLILDGIKNIALIDLNHPTLSEVCTTLSGLNPNANILSVAADCSIETSVEEAIAKTVARFGRLDVCFNAAGIAGEHRGMVEQSTANLDKVLGLNLRGLWFCERAQIKQMMKQELRPVSTGLPLQTRGCILNVGSICSAFAIEGLNPYVVAKHGVLGLTKSDAKDYAQHGIRVNCLGPGWVKTGMNKILWENEALGNVIMARAPMARWGMPEEVAYIASFLLSDKASFVTGSIHHVDGGYSAC